MDNEKNNDLLGPNTPATDWIAFQYFAGELSEEAALGFEASLEVDQSARESLARAVTLTQAVALAESTMVEPTNECVEPCCPEQRTKVGVGPATPAWMAPAAWLAVAALACVAILVFENPPRTFLRLDSGNSPATHSSVAGIDASELASRWVETAEVLVSTELFSEGAIDGDLEEPLLLEIPSMEADMDVDRLEAPSWMMAALAGSVAAESQE